VGDVVLFDQRGTGESTPSLAWQATGLPSFDILADRARFEAHFRAAITEASSTLASRGIDLSGSPMPSDTRVTSKHWS
jgi:pimeloyl-ACP methyl ester carboxylesterase